MNLFTKSKRAIVLGCGPAGLFAAHGLLQKGWSVRILSSKEKSHMYGAQYLHEPIPGLSDPDSDPVMVEYRLTGTVADYQTKVYGAMPVKTSPEYLNAKHPAWDIRQAYDRAWDDYGKLVEPTLLTPKRVLQLIESKPADLIVSSIPVPRICADLEAHEFHSTPIWAMGDAPDRGQYAPYRPKSNTVECNGTPAPAWYRASNIYDAVTVEWPGNKRPPLPGVSSVEKPIYSTCDCFQKGHRGVKFLRVGRYGTWMKGVLSHQAYTQAVSA